MIFAMMRVMTIRLWRDRGSLILAFALPGIIFAVFAAIFNTAAGGDLDLKIGIADLADTTANRMVIATLAGNDIDLALGDVGELREMVHIGEVDAGLILHDDIAVSASAGMEILAEPGRKIAAKVLGGYLMDAMPIMADTPQMVVTFIGSGDGPSDSSVTYYVGATAMLFLLFSAMQGAAVSLEERDSHITDRILSGPRGIFDRLLGKFGFLTAVGVIQAAIILATARFLFDVPVTKYIGDITAAVAICAAFCAALALLVASLCRTASQMHAVSTFLVLVLSALGGSMVPRFMMPAWLQEAGWATPNAWAIEGLYGILARGQSFAETGASWTILGIAAVLALGLAATATHRIRRY